MNKKQTNLSLADKIAGVLSAIPAQFDPDDDNIDDTRAKLTDFDDFHEESDDDEALLSKFRKQNVDLLGDVDQRYAGKKGSRKNLKHESSDEFSDEASDEDGLKEDSNDSLEQDEDIEKEGGSDSEDEDGFEEDSNDSLEQDEDIEEEGGSDSEDEDGSEVSANEENDESFQHMSETNISEQVNKGLCVRNQMNIWENLLEMRIQMQKCLVAANKMPQKAHYKEIEKDSKSPDFRKKIKETKDTLGNVLDKLLILQNLVIKKYHETKNLGKVDDKAKTNESDDEEIPSDTDEEIQEDDEESEEEVEPQKAKRRKLNDYEKDINQLHNKYKNYRNETIEKWNTKTRLSITKNSGQTHSVVSQIAHILSAKEKLRKRTQLKKSEYKILGHDDSSVAKLESNEDNGDVKQVEEYNTEIFDDSDFYHQLLRELIEVKSTDITDPVQLGRQWIQLQNLRSKMKRKIDTRATKGRKIRYAVHTKLVNFMAPIDKQSWTEEAKNELYNSLFGKIQSKRV